MKVFFIKWVHQWKELLNDRKFRMSLLAAVVFYCIALYVNFRSVLYTDQIPVISVGDLILDNIPTVNMGFMFTFGIYFTVIMVIVYPVFFKPELVPFTAKTTAAFILIRAVFISLTHLGAPENFFMLPQYEDQPGALKFFYMNDLFFSGHTGFPFLAALIFWENRFMRYFMILMSVGQSFTVLLLHAHYSIDVLSAFFITYTIYKVSDKIFNNLNLSFKKIVLQIEDRFKKYKLLSP